MSYELTDKQKDLLAHALFCYIAGIGREPRREEVVDLVKQLGVLKEFAGYAHEVVRAFEERLGPKK